MPAAPKSAAESGGQKMSGRIFYIMNFLGITSAYADPNPAFSSRLLYGSQFPQGEYPCAISSSLERLLSP